MLFFCNEQVVYHPQMIRLGRLFHYLKKKIESRNVAKLRNMLKGSLEGTNTSSVATHVYNPNI